MTFGLDAMLRRERYVPPKGLQGRHTTIKRSGAVVLGKPVYSVYAIPRGGGIVSGQEMWIGKIEFRNQWHRFAWYPDVDMMFDTGILAEVYAAMRALDRGELINEQ